MATTLPADWVPRLLEWADREHPKAAAQTRAVKGRPEVYDRYLLRLDDLWFTWAYGRMTTRSLGWTQEGVNRLFRLSDEMEAQGQTPRDAARSAFLKISDTLPVAISHGFAPQVAR